MEFQMGTRVAVQTSDGYLKIGVVEMIRKGSMDEHKPFIWFEDGAGMWVSMFKKSDIYPVQPVESMQTHTGCGDELKLIKGLEVLKEFYFGKEDNPIQRTIL